jgi:hypothetical protein
MSESNPQLSQFSSNKYTDGTKGFLESNSLVAKFAFLLLVLFMYIVLLRVGIMIIGFFFGPPKVQKLIDGLVNANEMLTFSQDPSISGAKTITRSQNASDGIEFSWSVWIFIDPTSPTAGEYKHIFHKGNSNIAESGLNFPNNAPGLYIAPNTNALVVIMNTYNVINEEIVIPDIPLNKWINVIIKCENTKLDVYINGTIAKSHILHGVPKQNYGDVYVAMHGGFSGFISNLWYYDYGLGTAAIQKLANDGPNTTYSGSSSVDIKKSDYLSLRWYFYGAANPLAHESN